MIEFPTNQHLEGTKGLRIVQGLISVVFLCLARKKKIMRLGTHHCPLFKRKEKHKAQVVTLNIAVSSSELGKFKLLSIDH